MVKLDCVWSDARAMHAEFEWRRNGAPLTGEKLRVAPKAAEDLLEAHAAAFQVTQGNGDLAFGAHSIGRAFLGTKRKVTVALRDLRSEEHTSESSHVKISYAVFCLKKKHPQN